MNFQKLLEEKMVGAAVETNKQRLFIALYTLLITLAGYFFIEVSKASVMLSKGLAMAIYVFTAWIVISWLEELIELLFKLLKNDNKANGS